MGKIARDWPLTIVPIRAGVRRKDAECAERFIAAFGRGQGLSLDEERESTDFAGEFWAG